MSARPFAVLLVAVLITSPLPVYASDKESSSPSPEKTALDPKNFCPWETKIEVAIYKVTISSEKLEEFDIESVEAAKSHKELSQKLKSFGSTVPVSLIRQSIKLEDSPTIQIGSSRPTPSGSQRYKDQVSTQVTYQDTGTLLCLKGYWLENQPESGYLNANIEVSYVSHSPIQLAPTAYAPIFHRLKQDISCPVRAGRPIVAVSVDCTEQRADATYHIIWIRFERSRTVDPGAPKP